MKEYIITEHPDFPYEEPKPQELIRCKDCKHWSANTQFCAVFSGLCTMHRMPPDGYCSVAERKEE